MYPTAAPRVIGWVLIQGTCPSDDPYVTLPSRTFFSGGILMLENRASGGRQRARRSSIPARLEMLEPRTLLSGITGYTLNVVSGPGINVAVDSSGDLWIPDGNTFGGTVLHKVVKNADGSLTDTVIPATGGDLWFSVYNPV